MKMKRVLFVFLLSFLLFPQKQVQAQHRFTIGTDIPLQYAIGYKYVPEKGLGAGLKFGVLTEPYSSIIVAVMEAVGTKKTIVDITREGFKLGLVLDGSASWNWGKNYAGANVIYVNLQAGEAPMDVVSTNYGGNYTLFWEPIFLTNSSETTQIDLRSNLLQLGAHYGRRVLLKENLELHLEIGLSANVGSSNRFSSDFPYPQSLYDSMDEDLQNSYRKYAIVPTLGAHFVYKL